MNRNLKALGLALVAAFAMSAVVASTASATQPWHFGSSVEHTFLNGSQHGSNDIFHTDAGTVSCNNATYTGTIKEADKNTTEVTVTPTYSGCTAFFFFNVPIDVNGCGYNFTAGTLSNGNYHDSAVHVHCPTKPIEVTAPGCTVTVPAQTITGGSVTFTNKGTGTTKEVTVDVNLSGITYEEHDEGTCPSDTVTKHNGEYTGAATVTGRTAAGVHVPVEVTGT